MTLRENRRSGVLLHPTSFPGPYGIGELGEHARTTLDWIASAGFRLWQVLPLGPTSYGDSPYACLSAFAGNPMLISMDRLVEDDLLAKEDLVELKEFSNDIVDFGGVIPLKRQLLEKAFAVWSGNSDPASRKGFESFCAEKAIWLDDYALFMALKYKHEQRPWNEWSPEFRDRDPNALD